MESKILRSWRIVGRRSEAVVEMLKNTKVASPSIIDQYTQEVTSQKRELKSLLNLISENDLEESPDISPIVDGCVKLSLELLDGLTKLMALQKIESFEPTPPPTTPKLAPVLPRVKLPTFSGQHDKWSPFWDLFTAMVHNNAELSPIAKFQYLKQSLAGEPQMLVAPFATIAENYEKCVELLSDKYSRPREIKMTLLNKLLSPIKGTTTKEKLKNTTNTVRETIMQLSNMGEQTKSWNSIVYWVLFTNIDEDTRERWLLTLTSQNKEIPPYEDLMNFIENRIHSLEISYGSSTPRLDKLAKAPAKPITFSPTKKCNFTVPSSCGICSAKHPTDKCPTLVRLSPRDRYDCVKRHHLCIICLSSGHIKSECRASPCTTCKGYHHTLLHFPSRSVKSDSTPPSTSIDPTSPSTSTTKTMHINKSAIVKTAILPTALIKVKTVDGSFCSSRCLLDQGSEVNIMSQKLADKLRLRKYASNIEVTGLGNTKLTKIRNSVFATLTSRTSSSTIGTLEFFVVDNLDMSLPSQLLPDVKSSITSEKVLADPTFHIPGKIDVILGVSACAQVFTGGKVTNPGLPSLFDTQLGWVVMGEISPRTQVNIISVDTPTPEEIDNSIKSWELEEIVNKDLSPNSPSESFFISTVSQTEEGRLNLALPFKEDPPPLGNSYNRALKTLHALEKKFSNNPEFHCLYKESMSDYINAHQLEPIDTYVPDKDSYYLPHLGVAKKDKKSLRIVFNASAPTTSGYSLNDTLSTGDALQTDIRLVLSNFRNYTYVISMDIVAMFLQLEIQPQFRDWLRVLWRNSIDNPPKIYRFTRLPFGLNCSPYLAIRSLRYLAKLHEDQYPDASKCIVQCTYLDDFLIGRNSIEDLITLIKQICYILNTGHFQLDKWSSNSTTVLNLLDKEQKNNSSIPLSSSVEVTTLLGLRWDPTLDYFTYSIEIPPRSRMTKRIVLSELQRVFDPLGFTLPIIMRFKILFQTLWKLNKDWDDPVPDSFENEWSEFRNQINDLRELKIHRHLIDPNASHMQIHGYCDASESAYGCVVYVLSFQGSHLLKSVILCSRARVAPLKTLSLPRLELLAAHLLAKTLDLQLASLNFPIQSINCFSDSQIVLSWIQSSSYLFKTFVSNRVSDIQTLTPKAKWYHVAGHHNPADLVSRGTSVNELLESNWFTGPLDQFEKPIVPCYLENISLPPEENKKLLVTITRPSLIPLMANFSSYEKVKSFVRVFLQFIEFIKGKRTRAAVLEIVTPEKTVDTIMKLTQQEYYPTEIDSLKKGKPLNKKSPILALNPFLDKSELLRVGGRITEAKVNYSQKFPILLPRDAHLTKLIVRDTHLRLLHCGAQMLQSTISQKYWIPHGRRLFRSVVFQCIPCAKQKFKAMSQIMASLPASRVTASRPFLITGVDFFGPLHVYYKRSRGARPQKAYAALFVCFVTKAIHIELVSDLTADHFLLSLQRFTSRRGLPREIHSDNGLTFVGADRQLKQDLQQINSFVDSANVSSYLRTNHITWKFIPPYAPSFGGLWEAGVKSAKHHLKRVVGTSILTFEEMTSFLTRIEAVLNSRPLVPSSDDHTSLEVLTPAHFLIQDSLVAIPDSTVIPNYSCRQRWHHVSMLSKHFWDRWHKEYLNTLQRRPKWLTQQIPPKVGQLVLLREQNPIPMRWITARIVDIIPGKDTLTRVVKLRTSNGTVVRPLNRISPLPIDC